MTKPLQKATFGQGCFWCIEAIYQRVQGVHSVIPGYAGGEVANPTYQQVCSGATGHAEIAQITFDPDVVSYEDLLFIFWRTHDPTTLNRQGADVGTQYRSVIFYHDESQRKLAEKSKAETEASDLWSEPIVTEIAPLTRFYEAENYHHNYFNLNPGQPYCQMVIAPKVKKFMTAFKDRLLDK